MTTKVTSDLHESPLDVARLAELVLDQGEAIAGLTAQVAALSAGLEAACSYAGVPGPAEFGAQAGAVADTVRSAYRAERMPVPEALALSAPARPALTVLRGGRR